MPRLKKTYADGRIEYISDSRYTLTHGGRMPHTTPWSAPNSSETKEMLKLGVALEDAKERFHGLIFRMGDDDLVVLNQETAHEYSRWTNHGQIYVIEDGDYYNQGNALALDPPDPSHSTPAALKELFLTASKDLRGLPMHSSKRLVEDDGGNPRPKKKAKMSDEDRKKIIARALELAEEGEIKECDACSKFALVDDMKTYHGSMGKEASLCLRCQW